MNQENRVEQLIEQRVQQAMERDLPRLLINFFHYYHAESWPQWFQSNRESIPPGVKSAKELERTAERITIEVLFGDTTFVFKRFKIGEDSIESDSYTYRYWTYEVLVNDRVVLGTEIKDHWAGGKPNLKEVTAYVPGTWENAFKELKSECEELASKSAAAATADRRRRNPPELKEKLRQQKIKERLERFGLDDNGLE